MNNKLSTALSAIVLLAFAGCASTPEPTPPPPAPAPAPAPQAPPPPPPPAPAPAPKAEKVTTASTANFDFDRYVIRPDARSKLDDLVGKLRNVSLEVVIAVGHRSEEHTSELQSLRHLVFRLLLEKKKKVTTTIAKGDLYKKIKLD